MPAFAALLLWLASVGTLAAPADEVELKWHTAFGLYLTPREAFDMKAADAEGVVFIDVRTRAEIKYIGIAASVDANIPVRMLREDYAWSQKSNTYRTRANPDFVAAVDALLAAKNLGRDAPVILMCQSGSRVPIGARLLHQAGFKNVYTQYQGFEGFRAKRGPHQGQRVVNGWKNAGLPWSYELDPEKMYFNFAPPPAAAD